MRGLSKIEWPCTCLGQNFCLIFDVLRFIILIEQCSQQPKTDEIRELSPFVNFNQLNMSIVKWLIYLLIAVLVYNLFFGTEEEKAQSKEIFSKVGELGREAWGILKSEKQKFDQGKYDEAVTKVGQLYQQLNNTAQQLNDNRTVQRVAALERQRQEIEQQLQLRPANEMSPAQKSQLLGDWNALMRETEQLMQEMEQQE